jgi:hypothetical protein
MKIKDAAKIAAAILLIPGGSIIVPLYLYKRYRDKKKEEAKNKKAQDET